MARRSKNGDDDEPEVDILPPRRAGENDLERLMRASRSWQQEEAVLPPPAERQLSLKPWAFAALGLVLICVGIELFWPLPKPAPLPPCDKAPAGASCQHLPPALVQPSSSRSEPLSALPLSASR